MFKVEQLPLWDVLKTVDDAQRAKVRKLIEDAAAVLDRVIETFPTYTLHNSTHAENVVQLMADLLGPRRADLSPLEAALLMLSAFYHDIGMVFREEERNRLTEESEWKTFLDIKPDAYLAVKKAGEVPLDIAEWYCRWRHADRVYAYLNRLPDELLKWGQTSIREELGELCRSHNLPPADLLKLVRTDFRSGEADLRFCAVLLRLADILDFDRTRVPEEVYEHLGLSRRIDPRQDASDVEWRKHLCSEGFRFPEKRPDGYQLGFIAGPDEPGVEYDIREFLRIIEEEMEQCRALLVTCSERWHPLPLPASIERSNIHSNGYRYGEYRFTLDQGQVMDLLMGENLYDNPYIFVRELVQNALDASRHRRFMERASGKPEFEPKPIQVRHWIDQDGYQWVRVDDDGMGMNEEIVRNHLLKVGSSYYGTAGFRAEILRIRERTHDDFVPISRFGIGLLSCFIIGDRVEISALRRAMRGEMAAPIRLSLNSLHGFFTLQTPHLTALPMQAPEIEEWGYRDKPGTSIAVRLDPSKESGTFDPKVLLKEYVAYPPIPVEFESESIGGNPSLLEHTWCKHKTISLRHDQMSYIELFFGRKPAGPINVDIIPIDLTRHSPTPELSGQLVLILVRYPDNWRPSESRLYIADESLFLELRREDYERIELRIELSEADLQWATLDEASQLTHNGIVVPIEEREFRFSSDLVEKDTYLLRGVVALRDSLRPRLKVSRDELIELPLRLYSFLGLALYEALSERGVDLRSYRRDLFSSYTPVDSLTLGELLEDKLLRARGPWSKFPIILTRGGLKSLQEIRHEVEFTQIELPIEIFYGFAPSQWFGSVLIQVGLNVYIKAVGAQRMAMFAAAGNPAPVFEGQKLFAPLMFMPFQDSKHLRSYFRPTLNMNHPFSLWLLDRAPEISMRYPGLFRRIRSELQKRLIQSGEWAERLNTLIDRLRELHPSVRPPKKLVLTEDDILD